MTLLVAAGLATAIIAALITVAIHRLRRPLSLERFRSPLEATLSQRVAPLRATVGSLSVTRLRWSGIEITARKVQLLSTDDHLWVCFDRITVLRSLSALLSRRGLGSGAVTGPWLFSGATVGSVQPQAPFEGLHGIATSTNDTLRFNIAGGRRGEVTITEGAVTLEGLTRADISFRCTSTAAEALRVVTTPPLDLVDLSVLGPSGIEGTVEADIRMAFAFDDLPRIDHHTRATIRDLRLPDLPIGLDLTHGLFTVTVTNDSATVEGTARLGDVPTTLHYSRPAHSEPETLVIETADLGALAATLEISSRLTGGHLHVTLARPQDDNPWSGPIDLRDIRVLQAPLLARLLTMASLPGFLSTLSIDGLTVDHASAEVMIEPGTIRCISIRISVDQLEITGRVDFRLDTGRIEGEGLLIPAASLQRLVGAVPVLGALLEGFSAKNAPIVATRFTLSGPLSYPEITVYPLSSLAPDILRDLGLS